ncbi:hypothetical protein V494_02875 [Pseudogymnoascus sp. VKM F-4513 (FW-928)]|nr:hypothetical protein V494_02875 [Pseudogymnoascus sp. VKM F-4513 (FW-928)]
MPSKIQLDENLWFLYICLQKSDYKNVRPPPSASPPNHPTNLPTKIDFTSVGEVTNLKPPAARMRYTRLRRQIESGSLKGTRLKKGGAAAAAAAGKGVAEAGGTSKRKRGGGGAVGDGDDDDEVTGEGKGEGRINEKVTGEGVKRENTHHHHHHGLLLDEHDESDTIHDRESAAETSTRQIKRKGMMPRAAVVGGGANRGVVPAVPSLSTPQTVHTALASQPPSEIPSPPSSPST